MLIGAQAVTVWVVAQATDMRKSIDGLAQLVIDALSRQLVSGEVFAFSNRGHDKVKLLWYDRTGFWLAYKRLERGRFSWPSQAGQIGLSELQLLLEGVDLGRARFRAVAVQRVD